LDDIEGLIHISELSEEHVGHPREVVQEGQTVTLRVIRVDSQRRRLGLSIKRVDSDEYADADWFDSEDETEFDDDDWDEGGPSPDEPDGDEDSDNDE
jgi:small subunit ribosomal protein S1